MTQPLVTCQFFGQLGNQLFIIATTMSYAWDHDAIPIFPGLFTEERRTSYNKDRLFFRLDTSSPPRPFLSIFRENLWHEFSPIPFKPDQILSGYFQSWKYFNHHRSKLLDVFAPSDFTMDILRKKYSFLFEAPNTVGVHLRTKCKFLHEHGKHPFLGLEYYRKAFDLFPKDFLFVICADRIEWCKKHLQEEMPDRKFVFIDGNYGIEDLFLLSKMKNNIIANSTFSWWAAYLNQNSDCKVVAPELWGGDPPPPIPPKDLFLPNWVTLPVDTLSPYPEDMHQYAETNDWDGNWGKPT